MRRRIAEPFKSIFLCFKSDQPLVSLPDMVERLFFDRGLDLPIPRGISTQIHSG